MKKILVGFYFIIFMMSCKDNDLILDLYQDNTHLEDQEILKAKTEVYLKFKELNKWYFNSTNGLHCFEEDIWRVCTDIYCSSFEIIDDLNSIDEINSRVLSGLETINLFTESFKRRIKEENKPVNLAYLMSKHPLAKDMRVLFCTNNHWVYDYEYRNLNKYPKEITDSDGFPMQVPDSDAQNYFMEMIRINCDKAYIVIKYSISEVDSYQSRFPEKYLVYSFKHDKKYGWQINNMQITIEEGLIVNE